jgi:hypothetical protein
MTPHDPVERLLDAINSRDPQRVADCFTPDYRTSSSPAAARMPWTRP